MQNRFNKKTLLILIVLLIALLAIAATVSAAETAHSDIIAKADIEGAEGAILFPISGTDQRLISPWAIDTTRLPSRETRFIW